MQELVVAMETQLLSTMVLQYAIVKLAKTYVSLHAVVQLLAKPGGASVSSVLQKILKNLKSFVLEELVLDLIKRH